LVKFTDQTVIDLCQAFNIEMQNISLMQISYQELFTRLDDSFKKVLQVINNKTVNNGIPKAPLISNNSFQLSNLKNNLNEDNKARRPSYIIHNISFVILAASTLFMVVKPYIGFLHPYNIMDFLFHVH